MKAGIYLLRATVDGHDAAQEADILLSAGEQRQIGLTVPSDVWQKIVAGEPADVPLGGVIAMPVEPMHSLYEESGLVVLAVAGKSVPVGQEEYSSEVRTELVISSVLKGDTRERVISVYHDQRPDEAPESRFQPGAHVLAFLNPRGAEYGERSDGYVSADAVSGLRVLPEAEIEPYRERIEALAQIPESGEARPAELLEWLVATAEDPVTREEAIDELSWAVRQLERRAGEHEISVDRYAQSLRDVFVDFLSTGGTPERQVNSAILAAFLTDAQRERLTTALLRTSHIEDTDVDLYLLVSPWHDGLLLPWVVDHLETAEFLAGRRLMTSLVRTLDNPRLEAILSMGEEQIRELEKQRYEASDEAARQRIGREVDTAEAELRRDFAEALGGLGGR